MINIRNMLIVGAGTMGAGIAQVAAESGFEVVLVDKSDHILERALSAIKKFVGRKLKKGKISQE